MIKVIDFDWPGFERFAIQEALVGVRGLVVVIGVAEGGLPLARRIHELALERESTTSVYTELKCQRPSTQMKKKSAGRERIVRALLSLLSKESLDWLRALEHRHLVKRRSGDLERNIELGDVVSLESADLVLIVDDAIDSGASMARIRSYLSRDRGVATEKIRVIVAAVTQSSPLVEPDFVWSRGALVRFPWSLDAK